MKRILMSLGMLLFLNSLLYAEEAYEFEYHKKREFPWGKLAKKLNLTEEQQKRLEENRKKQYEIMAELFKALKEEREKLRIELEKSDTNREKIKPIVENIKSLQAKILDQRIEGIFAIREILTPEQLNKFIELTKNRPFFKRKGHPRFR